MAISHSDILRDILASTTKYYSANPPSSTSDVLPLIDPSDIPSPSFTHVIARLADSLRDNEISASICQPTMKHVSQLTLGYRGSFENCCRTLLSRPHAKDDPFVLETIDNFRQTLQHRFEKYDFPTMLSKAIKAQASLHRESESSLYHRRPDARERKPFNPAFTPYLEAYLQQNAFPSSADQKMLAEKGNMDREQIITWFQNHRSRARKDGKEADLKRLPAGQMVNLELIDEKVRLCMADLNNCDDLSERDDIQQGSLSCDSAPLNLDKLVFSSADTVPKAYEPTVSELCEASGEAFGFPLPNRPPAVNSDSVKIDDLEKTFANFNIRSRPWQAPSTKSRATSSRASTPKVSSKKSPLKATLRSCFSAAITLTCPRSHPALVRQKKSHLPSAPTRKTVTTILEQKRLPVLPYTLPVVLPTWEVPAVQESEPARRKKPTILSHGGKTRPGSPYPYPTISRVSSTSSLASMASDDSHSSSRSSSSTFSTSTVDSSEFDTPVQSPGTGNTELIDDTRFSDDIFGDYFLHSNPIPDNFFFDINVEQPFDNDVSLSIAELDKSTSLSIAEFETTTLPSFDFFES